MIPKSTCTECTRTCSTLVLLVKNNIFGWSKANFREVQRGLINKNQPLQDLRPHREAGKASRRKRRERGSDPRAASEPVQRSERSVVDRRWMVVSKASATGVCQRRLSLLAILSFARSLTFGPHCTVVCVTLGVEPIPNLLFFSAGLIFS